MKPGKNLKERLARQAGAPGTGLPSQPGSLGSILEAERLRKLEAAAAEGEKPRPTATPPSRQAEARSPGAEARGASKSTTNQGLR